MCDMENVYKQQFHEAMNNFVNKIPCATQTEGKTGYKRINGILFIDFVDSILWSGRIALIWIIQLILAQILASIMFHAHTKTKKRSLLIRLLNSFYDVSRYKRLSNIMQHNLTFSCCFFFQHFFAWFLSRFHITVGKYCNFSKVFSIHISNMQWTI